MSTRSAGPHPAAAERVSTGALRWIRLHSGFLDAPSGHAELPVTPRVKALLQLALLCRHWERAAPADPALAEVRATVERVWRRPEYPRQLTLDPRYSQPFRLMYGALAPAGLAGSPYPDVLRGLAAEGFLAPRGKSPYLHLETRYYADVAGVAHRLHSYRDLWAASELARHGGGRSVAGLEVCNVTHTVFYLSDFGLRDPGLDAADLRRARDVVDRLTDRCTARGEWDLSAKLVLAQHCLGLDPRQTASGTAALRMLAEAQSADGAIPGRCAEQRADDATTPAAFFRMAYQATLVAALSTLIVCSARPGGDARTTATATATATGTDDAGVRTPAPAAGGAR
ncbi:DUF6895 family protein [Streptomyces sp. NPDC020917]|uniref:DUF6895 family protein n=1 Tax=Streptomyces sp. NPDC020917 TaxID=3365102 RepID=UPI0037AF6E43